MKSSVLAAVALLAVGISAECENQITSGPHSEVTTVRVQGFSGTPKITYKFTDVTAPKITVVAPGYEVKTEHQDGTLLVTAGGCSSVSPTPPPSGEISAATTLLGVLSLSRPAGILATTLFILSSIGGSEASEDSCDDVVEIEVECPMGNTGMNTCWKPLLEMDGRGFLFAQQHVASFLEDATDSTLVMSAMPDMSLAVAKQSDYDYKAEIDGLIAKLAAVDTKEEKDEIVFFDGKLNIALGIIGTMLLGYGQSIEEIMLHSFGETTAVYDSGVAVWKNKLMNSRIRPTTAIQELYPEETFTVNDGIKVKGKFFQALVRVMPHSEYPSGSSCVCQAVDDYLTDFWPELSLTMQGEAVVFDPATTPVVLPNTMMGHVPLTGAVNPLAAGYTSQTINQRCGETREEGGMHFTPAVPAGRALCDGMGNVVAATVKTLVPGVTEGTTSIRDGLGATPPCAHDCCAAAEECTADEVAFCVQLCQGTWDMPWFDVVDVRMKAFMLPDRVTATTMQAPFFQADRNHLAIIGTMGGVVPAILKTETIFQFRHTNTIDNLVWNSIAANSDDLKCIPFGQSQVATDPIVRSGQNSSDARIVTAVHAVAGALLMLLPHAEDDFMMSLGYGVLMPTIGMHPALVTACGHPGDIATTFNSDCLKDWYAEDESPSRLGQIIAFEMMYFKARDGWNSLGTDDGCTGGPHFCHLYADTTPYDPEVGACLEETLSLDE